MLLDLPIPREFISQTEFYDYKEPFAGATERAKELGAVVVTKDGVYYGMIDSRSAGAQSSLRLPRDFPVGKIAVRFPKLGPETDILKATQYFYDSRARALAYEEKGKIKGVVRRERVLGSILSLHAVSKVRIGDAMTPKIISIDSESTVSRAQAEMKKNSISRLLVMVKSKPFGIVTQGDVASAFAKPVERIPEMKADISTMADVSVGSIADMNIREIGYDESIDNAIRQMVQEHVSSLIVIRSGKAVGILTGRDILRATLEAGAESAKKISIAGLDDYTKEYEGEIRDTLENVIDKVSRFAGEEVSSIAVMVKRSRARNYELSAQLIFERKGSIHTRSSGFSLDSTLRSLSEQLYRIAKERKEESVTRRKGAGRRGYEEE